MTPASPVRPAWLKVRAPAGARAEEVARVLVQYGLRTVCRDARCPNIGECWPAGTATFLVLGGTCTRACGFCSVGKGTPRPPDPTEPARVARAAARLGLAHVVVTSVTRDDLPDGGAGHFASVVAEIRKAAPRAAVELLVPDFRGNPEALERVVGAGPDVVAHNVETVPRLYARVRPGADYGRSLELLSRAHGLSPGLALKSGLMVGLGESGEEVVATLEDLRAAGCGSVTIGQYLPPSPGHLPVEEYVAPGAFESYAGAAARLGFFEVRSAPLVRSSYRAGKRSP